MLIIWVWCCFPIWPYQTLAAIRGSTVLLKTTFSKTVKEQEASALKVIARWHLIITCQLVVAFHSFLELCLFVSVCACMPTYMCLWALVERSSPQAFQLSRVPNYPEAEPDSPQCWMSESMVGPHYRTSMDVPYPRIPSLSAVPF